MSSKYVDTAAITQVIGCVYNDPSLLDRNDEYVIREDDFVEDFHKIVFGSIYNIYLTGSKVSLDTIVDYLSNRPKYEAVFSKNNGIDYIGEASQLANLNTFKYYYNRLKKFSLLRAYSNIGLDVSNLYDPDNIMDIKRKQKQEDWLDNSSLQDIADSIDREIEKIKYKYVDDDYTQSHQAGDGVLDLINSLKEKPEVGVPLFGPLINSVTRGARLRKFYLRSAPTGCGKALPNDSLVPTPDGWKKVKDVQVGSFLFDRLGNPTRVIGKFPQPKPLDSYKIETRDGRVVYSSLDHLWTYYEGKTKRTETLEKLIQRLNNPKRTQPISFPTNGSVEFKENKDLISPFVAGRAIAKILTYRNRYKSFEQSRVVRKVYTLEPIEQRFVSEYPSMDQVPYIPDEYINCSRKQRLEFLKGMQMGFGGREDAFLIPYVSDNLEHSLRRMAWSLGMDIEVCGRYFSGKRVSTVRFVKQDSSYLEVLRVTKTGRQEEMTCFRVDNAESLFLMEDFLVTHNTRSLIADACNFACNKIYDDNFGWIKNGVSQPTLFIATEQDKGEVQTMMLSFLSNVNEEHILNGRYLPDEEERVIQAGQILMESPLWVEYLPDFSLQDVENKIKKNIREHNVAYVLNEGLYNTFPTYHRGFSILREANGET